MKTLFPDTYDFFPPTWNFPEDLEHFQGNAPADKIYLLKPTVGSQVCVGEGEREREREKEKEREREGERERERERERFI